MVIDLVQTVVANFFGLKEIYTIMASTLVFKGAVIHSVSLTHLELLPDTTLIITDGVITSFHEDNAASPPPTVPGNATFYHLPHGEFLIPGFIDTHNHAPQWPMRGRGQGLHILDWLDQVTFPVEARFADTKYAASIYKDSVKDFLRHGITTASYYSSRHRDATCVLADTCHALGQRAFIGKCNMDRNAPTYIAEGSASDSLRETEECISHIRSLEGCSDPNTALIKPILTPRFAISCTPELLHGLGEIARKDDTLAIQTHFNEAQQEIDFTRSLFPQFNGSEADLYAHYNLLTRRSILAHCTLMTQHETQSIKNNGCGVAHCPIANMTVGGGFMVAPIRQYLTQGIKVGLGTDSGGGWSTSMLGVIKQTLIASNAQEVLSNGADKALFLEEAFYLATLGGAHVLCLEDQIGNFAVGKDFDACVVRTTRGIESAMTPTEGGDDLRTLFEKFVMTGDDRNIAQVFVRGRKVAG